METWLILLGVLLPLAPLLQVVEQHLRVPGPRKAAVPVDASRRQRSGP
jgi:hypothetical protein